MYVLIASGVIALLALWGSMTLALLLGAALFLWIYSQRREPGTPDGPAGIPILGYAPFLGSNPAHTLAALSKKYGDVFSMTLGEQYVVVISSYDIVKEAFSKLGHVFSGRPLHFHRQLLDKGYDDLITTDGILAKENRAFTITEMKKFGIGKSANEVRIMEEIDHFLSHIDKNCDRDFDIRPVLTKSIANNICIFALGKRYDYKDATFIDIIDTLDEFAHMHSSINLYNFFPNLIDRIPYGEQFLSHNDKMRSLTRRCMTIAKTVIDEHRVDYKQGSERDYIDAYLTEMNTNTANKGVLTEKTLQAFLFDVLVAGMETTRTTLEWALLYMICHPDIQTKVQNEIDSVIGKERAPSIDDKAQMPYTEATILEIQRVSTLIPLNLPHRSREETELGGFKIPKNAFVLSNLWAIHHDEKAFPDPQSFRPERFIDADGQIVRPTNLIPFSIGKRACIGEPLARMELFLYFVSMLQRYTFSNPPGQVTNVKDSSLGTVNSPKKFNVFVTKRI